MKLNATIEVDSLYTLVIFRGKRDPSVYVGSAADLRPRLYKCLLAWSAAHILSKRLAPFCRRVQVHLLHNSPEMAYYEYSTDAAVDASHAEGVPRTIWYMQVTENDEHADDE